MFEEGGDELKPHRRRSILAWINLALFFICLAVIALFVITAFFKTDATYADKISGSIVFIIIFAVPTIVFLFNYLALKKDEFN